MVVKKLLLAIKYVFDRYKSKEMCDKVIIESDGELEFIPNCYKDKKMCNKAVDNYSHALRYVSNCYKT